jgi:hypothetical protein
LQFDEFEVSLRDAYRYKALYFMLAFSKDLLELWMLASIEVLMIILAVQTIGSKEHFEESLSRSMSQLSQFRVQDFLDLWCNVIKDVSFSKPFLSF